MTASASQNTSSLAILVVCGACHAAIPPVPSQGGPAWAELTSEHFVVWTDASVEDGRKLLRVMENLRQIVFGVSVFNPTSDAKAFVIAMRAQREVDPYVQRDVLAIAWPPAYPLFQPGILLSVDGLDYDRRVVTHELTHVISFNALPVQPRWFGEGLASYFETIHLAEDGSFDLGEPFNDLLRVLRQPNGGARVADVLACTELCCADAPFYATSWALYSYLANHRPDDLLRYVRRLVELQEDDQAAAWQDVFPELTPGKLDRVLDDWIKTGDLTVHHFKIKLKDFAVTHRGLSDSEIYTARALLRRHTGGQPSAEVTAALLADPNNVVANMINMDGLQKPDLEVARNLTAVHPDDWRAWWLHKLVTEDRDEAERDQKRACALVARSPAILPRGSCPSATPTK